ncbi:hypothetical protein F4775DRAFT_114596 [Biscogniauxia sp. FL1348]|nr:hypothetical protein F4775DRAFT_114596 [Biscogniauxia sp. FL1348]
MVTFEELQGQADRLNEHSNTRLFYFCRDTARAPQFFDTLTKDWGVKCHMVEKFKSQRDPLAEIKVRDDENLIFCFDHPGQRSEKGLVEWTYPYERHPADRDGVPRTANGKEGLLKAEVEVTWQQIVDKLQLDSKNVFLVMPKPRGGTQTVQEPEDNEHRSRSRSPTGGQSNVHGRPSDTLEPQKPRSDSRRRRPSTAQEPEDNEHCSRSRSVTGGESKVHRPRSDSPIRPGYGRLPTAPEPKTTIRRGRTAQEPETTIRRGRTTQEPETTIRRGRTAQEPEVNKPRSRTPTARQLKVNDLFLSNDMAQSITSIEEALRRESGPVVTLQNLWAQNNPDDAHTIKPSQPPMKLWKRRYDERITGILSLPTSDKALQLLHTIINGIEDINQGIEKMDLNEKDGKFQLKIR